MIELLSKMEKSLRMQMPQQLPLVSHPKIKVELEWLDVLTWPAVTATPTPSFLSWSLGFPPSGLLICTAKCHSTNWGNCGGSPSCIRPLTVTVSAEYDKMTLSTNWKNLLGNKATDYAKPIVLQHSYVFTTCKSVYPRKWKQKITDQILKCMHCSSLLFRGRYGNI